MTQITAKLYARGLSCPLPIVRTTKTLKGMQAGQVLEVTSSDPGSMKDMPIFCEQTGHHLMSSHQSGEGYVFLIEKT